jgi:tetratricopeptide (TPR) repeat protein
MPEKTGKPTVESLLPRQQWPRYQYFLDNLRYLRPSTPFLATIGIDTPRLGDAIVEDILAQHPDWYLEPQNQEISQNLYQLLHSYGSKQQPIVLPIYHEPIVDLQLAAEQLLWHRDIVTRERLNLVVLVSQPLYMALLSKAYDFISYSNVAEQFSDEAARVEEDLDQERQPSSGKRAFEEAERELKKYLKAPKPLRKALLHRYYEAGEAAYQISRLDKAQAYFEEAKRLAQRLKDEGTLSNALSRLGGICHRKQDYKQAMALYQRALELDRRTGDLKGEGDDLGYIGLAHYHQEQKEDALEYFRQALEAHRAMGYPEGQANHLGHIGLVLMDREEFDEALQHIKQALQIHTEMGFLRGASVQMGNIGLIYQKKNELEKALKYHKQALEIDRQIGFAEGEGEDLFNIGDVYLLMGEKNTARDYFNLALEIFEAAKLESKAQESRQKLDELDDAEKTQHNTPPVP